VGLLLKEIRHNPLLWLLGFVPVLFACHILQPERHGALFVLSVLCIVPLAVLISVSTESVAAKTGDTIGGLLNATLGNLTELIVALTALSAGQVVLVKSSLAGAIVAKTLVTLGASLLIGGLAHHVQEYNRVNARLQGSLLFLATIAFLVPSLLAPTESVLDTAPPLGAISLALSILLFAAYGLGMFFSLHTHREVFASATIAPAHGELWPAGFAVVVLAVVTIIVTLVSDIFVDSVQYAGAAFGMTPAFVGFIVVALVNGIAELAPALSSARKNRLDLSIGIALGGASQITLFVAPVLVFVSYFVGPAPMTLQFWPGAVAMILIAAATAILVTNSGRSAWFVGVLLINVYLIFAVALYLLPAPQ
jgi:Ca2+:H+ antiporter